MEEGGAIEVEEGGLGGFGLAVFAEVEGEFLPDGRLVLLELQADQLALEVGLDGGSADAGGELADVGADVDAGDRVLDGGELAVADQGDGGVAEVDEGGGEAVLEGGEGVGEADTFDDLGGRAVGAGLAEVAGDEGEVARGEGGEVVFLEGVRSGA